MDADHAGPVAFVALNVTDGMRARAAGFVDLPPGLAIGAVRLDLADDLNLEAIGVLDTVPNAVAAAAGGTIAVRNYAKNPMVRMLGLGPVLDAVMLAVDGVRVRGHLRVPSERREGLADKLLAIVEMVAAARPTTQP
jgi:hypothetical protein